MKRTITLIISALMLAAPVMVAQDYNDKYRNEVHFSYGYGSLTQIAGVVIGASALLGNDTDNVDHIHPYGSFAIGYGYELNDWLSLGAETYIEHSEITYKETTGKKSVSDFNTVAAAITGKAEWLRWRHFSLYSRLTAGVLVKAGGRNTIFNDNDAKNYVPCFQVSPIGIEGGWDRIHLFLEGGIGMQGTAICGVRFKF